MKKMILTMLLSMVVSMSLGEAAIQVESFVIEKKEDDSITLSWPRFVSDQVEEQNKVAKLNRKLAGEVQDVFGESYKNYAIGLPQDRYQFKSNYEIFYQTDRYISVVQEFYVYTGGANGNISHEGTIFDLVNQRKLDLDELFLPKMNYKKILTEKVAEKIEKMGKKEAYQFFKEVNSDTKCYFTKEGLVLLFSPYEIAPRSEGTIRILLPWEEIKNILKDEFRSL